MGPLYDLIYESDGCIFIFHLSLVHSPGEGDYLKAIYGSSPCFFNFHNFILKKKTLKFHMELQQINVGLSGGWVGRGVGFVGLLLKIFFYF